MNEDKISRTPDVTDERELIYCLPLYIYQPESTQSKKHAGIYLNIPIKVHGSYIQFVTEVAMMEGPYQRLYPIESSQFVSTTIY